LAKNIVKLSLRDLEALFNGAIEALAKTGVFTAKITEIVDATDLETTAQYEGCDQVTRKRQMTDKRGQVHEIEVTVYGWKLIVLIDAHTKLPLAATVVPIQEHETLSLRALVTQAHINLAAVAGRRLRRTIPLLEQALTGLVRDHHRRRLVAIQLALLEVVNEQSEALRGEIRRCLTELGTDDAPPLGRHEAGAGGPEADPRPPDMPMTCTRAIALLDTIAGVDQRGVERWVAETGIDMARVGTASRLAVWAGVAPGHAASAGQPQSGRTRPGIQPLRTVLTQLAHAAARPKETYLSALSDAWGPAGGRNGPSSPSRTRGWSVPFTCALARNPLRISGSVTSMPSGGVTSSIGSRGGLNTGDIAFM
jgi:hypothetical protein